MENPSLLKLLFAIPRGVALLIVGIGRFLSNQWKQYNALGQFLWLLALVSITVDCGIAYEFGSTLSHLHAIGFALVSLAFCILPDVAAMEFRKGKKTTGGWIAVACVPLGFVAFLTHVGYSATIRVGDMQQADVSNAKYEDSRGAVPEAQARVKQFTERIEQLKAANPWVTSVSADGLKAQADTVGEAIAQESRRGGCGPKCLALKEKQAGLLDQAAKAEELASHEKMLAAAQTGLEKAKARAADATFVSSTAVNHTDTLFKAASLVTGNFIEHVTQTEREATNTGIMSLSSLAFLMLAVTFMFAAGLNRLPSVIDAWIHGEEQAYVDPWERQAKRNAAPKQDVTPYPGAHLREEFTINDHRGVNDLRARLASNLDRALATLEGKTA